MQDHRYEQEDDLRFLDEALAAFAAGRAGNAVRSLFEGLREARLCASDDEWARIRERTTCHPVRDVVHEDPMTRHSFEKPRGYAGDAVLLDYIYGERLPRPEAARARAVYDYAVGRAAARAVRHRREWLAHIIDRTFDEAGADARVMSVACGHLREAEDSAAIRNGWLREMLAIDGDAQSLEVVDARGLANVRTLQMSIARLLGRAKTLGTFALVYSAGLYDYLEPDLAAKLSACLFERLAPGGTLLFSNFLPTVPDAGYMESLMGWTLIYRDLEELRALTSDIPTDQIGALRVYEDPFGAVGYLEVQRRAV